MRVDPPNGMGGEENQAWNTANADDADNMIRLYSWRFGVNWAGVPMSGVYGSKASDCRRRIHSWLILLQEKSL